MTEAKAWKMGEVDVIFLAAGFTCAATNLIA